MATRSRIGIELVDGAILSVYHHYDGYPQWLGVVLERKFNTKEKVAELIDGGDISCIDSDTDWDRQSCEHHVLYYNARGQENTEPRLDLTIQDYFENNEEYAYIFTSENVWQCYDLHPTIPQNVAIPENHPAELSM